MGGVRKPARGTEDGAWRYVAEGIKQSHSSTSANSHSLFSGTNVSAHTTRRTQRAFGRAAAPRREDVAA